MIELLKVTFNVSVWLLSLVLLLPYWAPRGLLVALGGAWLMAAYTCLVVPVLISANYKYPASWYPAVVKLAQGIYTTALFTCNSQR